MTATAPATRPYTLAGSPAPEGLLQAFDAYETALMTNDLDVLDELFAPDDLLGPGVPTIRGDAGGLLVGHDAIRDFRLYRGGAPARTLVNVTVQVTDPRTALIVAVTEACGGGRGQQTQLWHRRDARWMIVAAHVTSPAQPVDSTIWRTVGTPLVRPTGRGQLEGMTVAVKDLFAVAGHPVGAGSEAWLQDAAPESRAAAAVTALTDAGASVRGIARTDEFAYSLAGMNAHYGTPPNPKAPGHISGGSSSGSASAVSTGQAHLGLGSDTGGSIRVPASYQGLFGIRTTHGAVSLDGVMPLAPSFDTVGWMTRDAGSLEKVGKVLLPPVPAAAGNPLTGALSMPSLTAVADRPSQEALAAMLSDWVHLEDRGVPALEEGAFDAQVLPGWLKTFQTVQGFEAWQTHGSWVSRNMASLGADVAGRFRTASTISRGAYQSARAEAAAAKQQIRELVGARVLILPSASSAAPKLNTASKLKAGAGAPGPLETEIQRTRTATMQLTCLAGLAGLPAVSMPLRTADGLPRGACLVGPAGSDRALLRLAVLLSGAGFLAA